MKRSIVAVMGLVIAAATLSPTRSVAEPVTNGTWWKVTIKNLTPVSAEGTSSQPLSPPLFVVHSNRADVWSVGDIASHPVAAIAEDANNEPAESALSQVEGVHAVFTGAGDPIESGQSRSYMIPGISRFHRLTILTMLVNTNDAFTGLDSMRLPERRVWVLKRAYDAGSEKNNELAPFIPGPCCENPFVRDPEGELIAEHPGITGVGDLDPEVYDWEGPATMIKVTRM